MNARTPSIKVGVPCTVSVSAVTFFVFAVYLITLRFSSRSRVGSWKKTPVDSRNPIGFDSLRSSGKTCWIQIYVDTPHCVQTTALHGDIDVRWLESYSAIESFTGGPHIRAHLHLKYIANENSENDRGVTRCSRRVPWWLRNATFFKCYSIRNPNNSALYRMCRWLFCLFIYFLYTTDARLLVNASGHSDYSDISSMCSARCDVTFRRSGNPIKSTPIVCLWRTCRSREIAIGQDLSRPVLHVIPSTVIIPTSDGPTCAQYDVRVCCFAAATLSDHWSWSCLLQRYEKPCARRVEKTECVLEISTYFVLSRNVVVKSKKEIITLNCFRPSLSSRLTIVYIYFFFKNVVFKTLPVTAWPIPKFQFPMIRPSISTGTFDQWRARRWLPIHLS